MQLFGAEQEAQKPPTASENTHEGENKECAGENRRSWTCVRSYSVMISGAILGNRGSDSHPDTRTTICCILTC